MLNPTVCQSEHPCGFHCGTKGEAAVTLLYFFIITHPRNSQGILALLDTPAELAARELRYAVKGGGTTERTLIEIICTSNNTQINDIKKAYQRIYDRNLENDIAADTSGENE